VLTEVLVRRATDDDYVGICALASEVDEIHRLARPDLFRMTDGEPRPREEVEKWIASEDTRVLVAEEARRVVGLAIAYLKRVEAVSVMAARSYVLLDMLAVSAERRRCGVGRRLVLAVEEWAIERGVNGVELGVHDFNGGARALYESLGYDVQLRRLQKRILPVAE
jgi:ribosomal protein S18 acetylase RimI-like enzyme